LRLGFMFSSRFRALICTVTGGRGSRAMTLVNSQASRSIEKGNSSHQPWLITVRGKLKVLGVGMVIGLVIGDEFDD
jgi:hypothetical protein